MASSEGRSTSIIPLSRVNCGRSYRTNSRRRGRTSWHFDVDYTLATVEEQRVYSIPEGRKIVGSKWVFKKKTKADESIERYRAQLVAQGFSPKQGLDYDETFSPVIRFESFRSLVAVAVQKSLKLHQLVITTVFLNGHLKEEVFMGQPAGFVIKGKENLVCKLKQNLYGLKQSLELHTPFL